MNSFPWKFCSGVRYWKKLASVLLRMSEKWSVAIDFICLCWDCFFVALQWGCRSPALYLRLTHSTSCTVFGRNQNTCPLASASMWFRYRGNNPSASTITKPFRTTNIPHSTRFTSYDFCFEILESRMMGIILILAIHLRDYLFFNGNCDSTRN